MKTDYQKIVLEYCRREKLFSPGSRIVAGVSGGADSVCLLLFLCRLRSDWDLKITAVHVHHGIRGAEADRDLEFTRKLCERLDVPFCQYRINVPEIASEQGLTLEEAGRLERYRIFREACIASGSDTIAVAHHMDDQAETVLFNLFRGSGLRGMGGMAPRNGQIVRPLLCLRKGDILDWLGGENETWVTDSTNCLPDAKRNVIRQAVLPVIQSEVQEKAAEHIAAAAKDFREADEWFRERAKKLLFSGDPSGDQDEGRYRAAKELFRMLGSGGMVIPLSVLKGEPHIVQSYMVCEAVRKVLSEKYAAGADHPGADGFQDDDGTGLKDFGRKHFEAVLNLDPGRGIKTAVLPYGIKAVMEYGAIRIFNSGQALPVPHFRLEISVKPLSRIEKKIPQNSCINWFDYDKIKGQPILRTRRSGDRVAVDICGRSKKLKDYMIDARIPAQVRDRYPVVACGDHILWIPGLRMDMTCRVTETTETVLILSLKW